VIVFRNVAVVDGNLEEARTGLDVLVDDGVITAVEPADADRELPAGAVAIDGTDATLVPGLIDCLVHYTLDPEGADRPASAAEAVLRAAGMARRALEAGVTTARSGGARDGLDILLRDAIDAGDVRGPRLLAAGPVLTPTGGFGRGYGREVDGPEALAGAVRANVRDGADVIAVIAGAPSAIPGSLGEAGFSSSELEAIVAEAARLGRRVMAHAETTQSLERAVWAGVASVEHGFGAEDTVAPVFVGSAVAFVPTLVDGASDDEHRRTVQAMLEHDVPIVAGTGCGRPGIGPDALARELALIAECGARPIDALRAATIWAAQLLGLGERLGVVDAGFAADLLLVDGDPLADLSSLARPRLVLQAGAIVHQRS
jgi:imidazolonepropionase-like amidohydrolase